MTTLSKEFEEFATASPLTEQLAKVAQPILKQGEKLVPDAVMSFLHGEFLGHPLHPVLIHLPLGGWIASSILDYWPGGNAETEKAADLALLLATAGAFPTLATGWTEWSDLSRQPRRTGIVHGVMEETAVFLNLGSLLARKKGKRGLGKLLSGLALGTALAGSMLGGELVYGHGVGVKS